MAASAAMIFAIIKRPSRRIAAVAMDEKLGLHEKISTALFMRNSTDPFAIAAVKDAENRRAGKVAVNFLQHFPLRMPQSAYATCGDDGHRAVGHADSGDWISSATRPRSNSSRIPKPSVPRRKSAIKHAYASVESVPKSMANDEAIKKAQIDLQNLMKQPIQDPEAAKLSAYKAMQDARDAIKQQAENNARLCRRAEPDEGPGPQRQPRHRMRRARSPMRSERSPKGNSPRRSTSSTMSSKSSTRWTISKSSRPPSRCSRWPSRLQQAAGNPQQQQQQLAKQLQQQLGVNQQQAQQMAQQMQQAAQGNQQAQQQLQQQAQQMMKQMNNGNGADAGAATADAAGDAADAGAGEQRRRRRADGAGGPADGAGDAAGVAGPEGRSRPGPADGPGHGPDAATVTDRCKAPRRTPPRSPRLSRR